eukprot:CCRYP_015116-RA/>CCRYP_015116-RA protein AED:0.05 eAED:0.05 QI:68/1/1/1/0/0.5/2/453/219
MMPVRVSVLPHHKPLLIPFTPTLSPGDSSFSTVSAPCQFPPPPPPLHLYRKTTAATFGSAAAAAAALTAASLAIIRSASHNTFTFGTVTLSARFPSPLPLPPRGFYHKSHHCNNGCGRTSPSLPSIPWRFASSFYYGEFFLFKNLFGATHAVDDFRRPLSSLHKNHPCNNGSAKKPSPALPFNPCVVVVEWQNKHSDSRTHGLATLQSLGSGNTCLQRI